jgi:hypothetical protein
MVRGGTVAHIARTVRAAADHLLAAQHAEAIGEGDRLRKRGKLAEEAEPAGGLGKLAARP